MKARSIFTVVVILCLNLVLTGAAAADAAPPNPMEHLDNPSPLRLPVDQSTPTNDIASPDASTNVETLTFTTIAAGEVHTCALTAGGAVKCWGYNGDGALGDGTTIHRSTPADVNGLSSGVTALTTGGYHTCALMDAVHGGGVKCWGDNSNGQLGDGTTTRRITPIDVNGLSSGIIALAAGYSHTCALMDALHGGGVKCWGDNWAGQLGDGTTTDRTTPVPVSGLSGVIALAAGRAFTCAMTAGGGIKCWGDNRSGQLGDGTTTSRSTPVDVNGLGSGVVALAAGWSHICAVTANGGSKCWGDNSSGQLGDGSATDRSTPVDVSGLGSGVTALAAGGYGHTCAMTASGVKCWGANDSGQLGDGTTVQRNTPADVSGLTGGVAVLAAGYAHTCALMDAAHGGGVRCWGDNSSGQIGDGTILQRSTALEVSGLTSGVTALIGGGSHTCALMDVVHGSGIKCWGSNYFGQLGDGTTVGRSIPVDVNGLGSDAITLTAGYEYTCAVTAGGGVRCWGRNSRGCLGDGTTVNRSAPVDVSGLTSGVTAVTAGYWHTCALTAAGGVKCWGGNDYGQLGDGTTTRRTRPVDVSGLTSGVTAVAAGYWHTCALMDAAHGGGVKCWGARPGTSTSSTPVDVAGLNSGVIALAAGGYHDCVLTTGGGIKCWGRNWAGQLGDGTTTDRSTPVDVIGLGSGVTALTAAHGSHTCAVITGNMAKCWGDNTYGQLGDGTTISRSMPVNVDGLGSGVTTLAAGWDHTCALVSIGRPKCWGVDHSGQLGVGRILRRLTPVEVVETAPPSLTINYPDGQPGSFFTLTGWNFPPNAQATLSFNGQVITRLLRTNATGSFVFFLDTTGAGTGNYDVTVSVNPSATTSFTLADGAPLRPQEGGGRTVTMFYSDHFVYLPLVKK